MRIVVTGANGNVGTSVVQALLNEHTVDHIIGLSRRIPLSGDASVEWRSVDIAKEDLTSHFRGVDAVIHLAWQWGSLRTSPRANMQAASAVFTAAAKSGVGALLHASSAAVYGPPRSNSPLVDESWPFAGRDASAHVRQKVAIERLLNEFEEEHQFVRVVRLRPALTLKPEAASQLRSRWVGPMGISLFRLLARFRTVPDVPGFTVQVVHSDDVAEAYRLALLASVTGPYNVAAEPLLDADLVAQHFRLHRLRVNKSVARMALSVTKGVLLLRSDPIWLGIGNPQVDTSLVRGELRWTPKQQGLAVLARFAESLAA